MTEPLAEFPVLHQHLVLEMVMDRLRDLLCPLATGNIGRQVDDDLKPGIFRKILHGLDNVVFCCRIQLFLMERCRIE